MNIDSRTHALTVSMLHPVPSIGFMICGRNDPLLLVLFHFIHLHIPPLQSKVERKEIGNILSTIVTYLGYQRSISYPCTVGHL